MNLEDMIQHAYQTVINMHIDEYHKHGQIIKWYRFLNSSDGRLRMMKDYGIDKNVEVVEDSDVILDELFRIGKQLGNRDDIDDSVIFRIWKTKLLESKDYKDMPIEWVVGILNVDEIMSMPIKRVYRKSNEPKTFNVHKGDK